MSEPRVSRHRVVYLTYDIHGEDGTLLERWDLPIAYVHGVNGELFARIERALEGAAVGDTVEVILRPEDAFGAHRPELTFTDEIENVPPEYRRVGAEASFANERGETVTMAVTRIADGRVTLDGNHPFAGRTLLFRVTVTGVRDATAEEIGRGTPADGRPPLN